jgi:hypothetical protein
LEVRDVLSRTSTKRPTIPMAKINAAIGGGIQASPIMH